MIREAIDTLLKGQGKVLVVGLGITGIETALFLRRCGIEALCVEKSSQEEYLERSKFKDRLQELVSKGISLHFGIEGESVAAVLQGVTLAVLSPGVSLESAIVGTLRRHNVKFVSELELGIVLAGIPAIGVTGSNGKTTTATLIHHLLNFSGIPSLLCGNVGTPVLSALSPDDVLRGKTEKYKYLVVEASSYQLESCEVIKPKIAVFLNLSDNHVCSLSAAITLRSYGQPYASMLSCASCLFHPTPMLKPKTTGERARLVEPFVCSIVDPCKSLSL
jgi:UDP-N-acetylmuramoylalanine--D-glutamate ligase